MLPTRPLDSDSGNQYTPHFAVQKTVAMTVSGQNCHEFILKTTGTIESPNYPNTYPDNLNMTETIEVGSGKILRLVFEYFDIDCPEFVKITDRDGNTLMDEFCGDSPGPYGIELICHQSYYYNNNKND